MPATDRESLVRRVAGSVLVMCGDEDHGAPPDNSRQMAAMIKGARFVEIKQAGHIANIEQPAIFNSAVRGYFDQAEAK